MKTLPYRIIIFCINYVTLHIFLSLVSLPFIIAWGLPSSWLSLIGNFLFNPLISLFLFLSSLAFFSELIGVPHELCNWLLEHITAWWFWLLKLAPHHVLYGFNSAPWWIVCIIACITFASVMHPLMRHPLYRLCGLTTLFIFSMFIVRAHEPSSLVYTMPCKRGSITLIRTHNSTIVIDPGYLTTASASSWIAYTFMPELIAKTGSLTIDHLIILKPTSTTCEAIDTLLDNAYIAHIYLPSLTGTLTGSFKQSFLTLYAHIKQRNIPLTRIDTSYRTIYCDAALRMTTEGIKKYQTITYPHIIIEGNIGDTYIKVAGR